MPAGRAYRRACRERRGSAARATPSACWLRRAMCPRPCAAATGCAPSAHAPGSSHRPSRPRARSIRRGSRWSFRPGTSRARSATWCGRSRAAGPPCVIVVDDCSSDDTADEARAAGAEVVIRHEREPRRRRRDPHRAARGEAPWLRVRRHPLGRRPARAGRAAARAGAAVRGRGRPGAGLALAAGRGHARASRPDRRWLTRLYPLLFRLASGYPSPTARTASARSGSRCSTTRAIRLEQDWLDRYELEPYLLLPGGARGYRVREAPGDRPLSCAAAPPRCGSPDGWRILRPLVYLRLGLRH